MSVQKSKKQKGLSVRLVLIVLFSTLSSVVVMFMGGCINHITAEYFTHMAYGYNEQLTTQIKENLDAYFENINETLMFFVSNRQLYDVVTGGREQTPYEQYTAVKTVQNSINSLLSTQQDIRQLFVFSENAEVYIDDANHAPNKSSEFLKELLDSYPSTEYMRITYYPVMNPDYYASASLYKMQREIPISLVIRDITKYDTRNQGVILASLSTEHIDGIFSEIKNNGGLTAFIIDEDDTIYYNSDNRCTGIKVQDYLDSHDMRSEKNGRVYNQNGKMINLSSAQPLAVNNWRLVVLSDLVELNKQLGTVQFVIFSMTILTVLLMIACGCVVAVKVTKPLMILTNEMNQMDGESGKKLQQKHLLKEISMLYDSYNEMRQRIEFLIYQVYYGKLRQKDAEYEALQSKINPHFLYNALQTIHSLAVLERHEDVETVTASLGEMLEYLVYEKDGQVYFQQELDYINSYTKIQQIRYSDSFSISMNITEEARRCVIHKLLIQPIVENAINHGLVDKENGELLISAWVGEEVLQIVVRDNGAGMDEQTLERLMKHVRSENRESKHKSIGLPNIQERLVLKYGSQYGISIKSEPDEGTEVIVRMPAIKEKIREESL